MNSNMFERHRGLVDVATLAKKVVCFVGLGSVGSQAALWLAKCGVGHFRFLDPDTVSEENILRHAALYSDVGRPKTEAVADLVRQKNPRVETECFQLDVALLGAGEESTVFDGVDLVIASTDSNLAQFTVNRISLARGLPALYIGVYEKGSGGEIVFSIPGKTACFNCCFESRTRHLKPIEQKRQTRPYAMEVAESEEDRLAAEPGLAVDVDYVTASAMPYALALVDPNSKRNFLIDSGKNVVFLSTGSEPGWIFTKPFSRVLGEPDKGCSICEPQAESEMTEEEATAALSADLE